MNHILEFDFRYSSTWDVIRGLDQAFANRDRRADGMEQLETAETIIGIGYIALQTYITGAIADLGAVFQISQKPHELRAMAPTLGRTGATVIEAVWSLANYFKHHEEWPDWNAEGSRRSTIETLTRLHIAEDTEFPCIELMKIVEPDHWRLLPLLESGSRWREGLFTSLRAENE